jgi:hypothetical protein
MAKHFFQLIALGVILSSQNSFLHGETDAGPAVSPTQDHVRYIGAPTCLSSMCHGGASPSRDQFTIWSHQDFHSRAFATLITARSVQIGASVLPVAITSPETNSRCTVCHAPLADVPAGHLASTASVTEGVSCENCHNGAATWLRSHTRPDYTYADRLHAGLRDLRNVQMRAETCVACHQVIDPALVKAGHPELTFELDGQTASEPRHWTEKADWSGPKAWYIGQIVALRHISMQAWYHDKDPDLKAQMGALLWLTHAFTPINMSSSYPATAEEISLFCNSIAGSLSTMDWTPAMTRLGLTSLAETSSSFTDNTIPTAERELRAERLVLGLDRLFKATHPALNAPGQAELAALFELVQDPAHFDAPSFAQRLQKFADAIKVSR